MNYLTFYEHFLYDISLFYLILGSNFQMTITFLIIKIERPGLCHFKALDLHFPGIITIFQEHVSNSRNSRNRTDPEPNQPGTKATQDRGTGKINHSL